MCVLCFSVLMILSSKPTVFPRKSVQRMKLVGITSDVNMHLRGKETCIHTCFWRKSPASEVKEGFVNMAGLRSFLFVPLLRHRQDVFYVMICVL